MADKKITIDDLATMINKGFDNMTGQISVIKNDVADMKNDIKEIKQKLDEKDGLETRVDYIENVLAIKK